jgi:predicted MPP superfamily phosphohydrolase
MPLFISIALSIWACLNGYVFWRLGSLPVVASCLPKWALWTIAALCVLSLPASRWLPKVGLHGLGSVVELGGMTWVGFLFLFFACFVLIDVITLGGFVFTGRVLQLRTGGAVLALVLSVVALVQGMRAPVVREHVVTLPGLPRERDGLRMVFLSDLHLGGLIGQTWLQALTAQVAALKPDLIAIGGDLVDHDAERVRSMIPDLRELRAPLGVWSVLGNHDSFGGTAESSRIMQEAGFRVLHDASELAAPGLRIAGVDDLGLRVRSAPVEPTIRSALQLVRPGTEACVFLSHTPVGMNAAAEAGAGLMLCGHTHGGQIWPFSYLVQLRYPELVGRHGFAAMTLIIGRGTGTWGPRMRLWRPGEILLITLRAP